MQYIKTKKGLDLPISGVPEQVVNDGPVVKTVAVLGSDYIGMKPTMLVQERDFVKKGQPLFEDKKTPGVLFTAPTAGIVTEINRGAKRALQSVVITVNGKTGTNSEIEFDHWKREDIEILGAEQVQDVLVKSGMWSALRTRPYSKIPSIGSKPSSIFVTAIDTAPLAADPTVVAMGNMDAFEDGLRVLARLTANKIFVCQKPGAGFKTANLENAEIVEFNGPHPAGLVGTHIHYLDPVGPTKTVWHINYQDVIAIGQLFINGKLYSDRVIAVAGPQIRNPKLIRTTLGANISEIISGELANGENRVISGSVLQGNIAADKFDYLGRYHSQISVVEENRDRLMLHYVRPNLNKFSVLNILFSSFFRKRRFNMNTSTNGSLRAMVPIGYYERLIPLDILPTQLLRSVITIDTDLAQQLGVLELDEEDLSLCTYVSSSKVDYGIALRQCLTKIEIEG